MHITASSGNVGTNKCYCDHEMSECEPVGAVSEKRIERVCSAERIIDMLNPRQQPGEFGYVSQPTCMKNRYEPAQFRL